MYYALHLTGHPNSSRLTKKYQHPFLLKRETDSVTRAKQRLYGGFLNFPISLPKLRDNLSSYGYGGLFEYLLSCQLYQYQGRRRKASSPSSLVSLSLKMLQQWDRSRHTMPHLDTSILCDSVVGFYFFPFSTVKNSHVPHQRWSNQPHPPTRHVTHLQSMLSLKWKSLNCSVIAEIDMKKKIYKHLY